MTHTFSPLRLRRALIKNVLNPDDCGMMCAWRAVRAANSEGKTTVRWSRNLDAAFEAVMAELARRPVEQVSRQELIDDYRSTAGLARKERRWAIGNAILALVIEMHAELMERAMTAHGRMRLVAELRRLDASGEQPRRPAAECNPARCG